MEATIAKLNRTARSFGCMSFEREHFIHSQGHMQQAVMTGEVYDDLQPAGFGLPWSLCTTNTKASPVAMMPWSLWATACAFQVGGTAGTDVLLMRLRDEDVEILEENQALSFCTLLLLQILDVRLRTAAAANSPLKKAT